MSVKLYNGVFCAELGVEALVHHIADLKVGHVENVSADASNGPDAATRKRKARPRAHFGLPTDSSERLSLIALSRLVRSTNLQMLNQIATSPIATALLAALRPVVQRAAAAAGTAELNTTSVDTLFNLSGSSFISQSRYDGSSLSLPDKLPYQNAKALVRSMLDSLTTALLKPEASAINRLLLQLPFAPLDEDAQSKVDSVLAIVETDLTERLASGGGGGGSSSSTTSSRPPPPPPLPSSSPSASPPINATSSLAQNAIRAVESRLGRPTTTEENATLTSALLSDPLIL